MHFRIDMLIGMVCFVVGTQFLVAQQGVSKIAFGSCAHQDQDLPIFDVIVKHKPDLFIFLGDNIYGDSKNMDTILNKYQQLDRNPSFQNLRRQVPIIATWDDHDYGWNDAGRHYPFKDESKKLFLDFFKEPENSKRRERVGIYTSYMFETGKRKLQIILLDNRTFRDDLKIYDGSLTDKKYFYPLDYLPHENSDSTLLGIEQWKWLESELSKPADIRIIGSGSQFGAEFNGYEAWANFPQEQKKLLELIKKTKANGVFFISGDVHYAEISKLNYPELYPIYDITSSGLSSTWDFATPNINRIEGPIMDNHFGLLTIQWMLENPRILMEIWDISDNQRVEYSISLSEIKFK